MLRILLLRELRIASPPVCLAYFLAYKEFSTPLRQFACSHRSSYKNIQPHRSHLFSAMFRFRLIVVGKVKEPAIKLLCEHYADRMRRQYQVTLDLIEVKDAPSPAAEGKALAKALGEGRTCGPVYALAEEGRQRNSVALAEELAALPGRAATFVIGGAYGLCPEVKQRADALLSLSALTLTHELARLFLCEQLYRCASITAGSKYHHV